MCDWVSRTCCQRWQLRAGLLLCSPASVLNVLRAVGAVVKISIFQVGVLTVFGVCGAGAQTTSTSQISGLVQDSRGAQVAGAQVTVTNAGTGVSRSVTSGPDGAYTIGNLVSGAYQLKASKAGFSVYVQSGIMLQVSVNPQINVPLQPGSVNEKVTVEADAAMVETQSNGVGQVIDQRQIVDLPLNGRQVSQLVTLAGAAVSTFNGANADNRHYPSDSSFSVAGGSRTATNFLLDGGANNDSDNSYGLPMPFPDALLEFKVETSALPASYGNHCGGAVNVVTKSGTQRTSRRCVRVRAELPFQLAELLCACTRQSEAQPVWRHGGRGAQEEQALLLPGLSRHHRQVQSLHQYQFRAHGRCARRRLHPDSCAGLQRRKDDHPQSSLRGQQNLANSISIP